METTGSDLAAGSTTGAAAATATNGNWNSATGVFIAPSGTPFSATQVGDWASIYLDAASLTPFIGKVTVVTSNVNITIDVATNKYGTQPTTGATGRSCKIGGAWASFAATGSSGPFGGSPNALGSTRINIKAGTYANTTTNRSLNTLTGATTIPVWYRGYKTTPGDMDNAPTSTRVAGTDIPHVTFTSGSISGVANHVMLSSISILATTATGAALTVGNAGVRLLRLRVENQNAAAGSSAATLTGATLVEDSWFKATSTATRVVQSTAASTFRGCVYAGGGIHLDQTSSASFSVIGCAFISPGSNAIKSANTSGVMTAIGNTFYGCGGDAILCTGTLSANQYVLNNLFSGTSGYDINNNTGTSSNFIRCSGNSSYNPSTGHLNGVSESAEFSGQTEVSQPVTSSSDMTPVSGALARNNALPGLFENVSFSTYTDIGAVDHADPSSGGVIVPAMIVGLESVGAN